MVSESNDSKLRSFCTYTNPFIHDRITITYPFFVSTNPDTSRVFVFGNSALAGKKGDAVSLRGNSLDGRVGLEDTDRSDWRCFHTWSGNCTQYPLYRIWCYTAFKYIEGQWGYSCYPTGIY